MDKQHRAFFVCILHSKLVHSKLNNISSESNIATWKDYSSKSHTNSWYNKTIDNMKVYKNYQKNSCYNIKIKAARKAKNTLESMILYLLNMVSVKQITIGKSSKATVPILTPTHTVDWAEDNDVQKSK